MLAFFSWTLKPNCCIKSCAASLITICRCRIRAGCLWPCCSAQKTFSSSLSVVTSRTKMPLTMNITFVLFPVRSIDQTTDIMTFRPDGRGFETPRRSILPFKSLQHAATPFLKINYLVASLWKKLEKDGFIKAINGINLFFTTVKTQSISHAKQKIHLSTVQPQFTLTSHIQTGDIGSVITIGENHRTSQAQFVSINNVGYQATAAIPDNSRFQYQLSSLPLMYTPRST